MDVSLSTAAAMDALQSRPPALEPPSSAAKDDAELRQAFNSFVGQVFFGQRVS